MERTSKEISDSELFDLLKSISKYFERKIRLYALGGTALTLLGIKTSTRDIDLDVELSDYKYITGIFGQIGFRKDGIRWWTIDGIGLDLFHGENVMGTQLPGDATKNSKHIRTFGNIELYTLSPYDIILDLIEIKFNEWGLKSDKKLIQEVEKWDLH